jgi:spore coat protein U-like protein
MSSRSKSNLPIGLAAIAGLLLAAETAGAQSVQDQKLLVQARIGEICTVISASLDFGQDVNLGAATNAEGAIVIDCVIETGFDVALDGGLHNAFGSGRRMSDGESNINYTLYSDAGRSNEWSPGELVPAESGEPIPVYGTIPDQVDGHSPGLYTDEVLITLSF